MGKISPLALTRAQDASGNAVSGATLAYFQSGTSTPAAIYSDVNGQVSLGTSLTSDANGFFAVHYLDDPQDYKAVVTIGGVARVYDWITAAALSEVSDVDTVANLKKQRGGFVSAVFVRAHTTAGDGGHGWFVWDSSSTATDDNAHVLQPNAGGTGRWLRRLSGYLDPRFAGVNASAAQTAVNVGIAAIKNGVVTSRDMLIQGNFTFTGALSDLDTQLALTGTGINGTSMTRNFNGTLNTGFLNIRTGGVIVRGLSPQAAAGTSGGNLIDIRTNSGISIGSVTLEDVYATTAGTNTHNYTLEIDGTTSLSNLGVRTTSLRNVELFGGALGAARFSGVKNLYWHGGGAYSAGGTSGDILITGSASVKSEGVLIDISDAGNITVDADVVTSAIVRVVDPSGNVATQGSAPDSNIVFESADMEHEDMCLNGSFQVDQLVNNNTPRADDAYGHDCWYVLTESGNVNVSTVQTPEQHMPQCARLTQPDVSAKRIGYATILESGRTLRARGGFINLSFRVRCSSSQAIRYAICEWTGTIDQVTSDIVNNWASSTYTAGNFFLASNLNPLLVSAITPSANTWAPVSRRAQMNLSANNLILFVWTEGTLAQNGTLDIGRVKLQRGSVPTRFVQRPYDQELTDCMRYLQKSFTRTVAPAQNAGVGGSMVFTRVATGATLHRFHRKLPVTMFATPSATLYNPSATNSEAREIDAAADCTGTVYTTWGPEDFQVVTTTPAGGSAGSRVGIHYLLEARL